MAEPSYSKLTASHFYSWSLGLKTGQYYLRSRPAREPIKFTINVESFIKSSETTGNSNIFSHMNSNNLSKAEMDQKKRVKKRKFNEMSKSDIS